MSRTEPASSLRDVVEGGRILVRFFFWRRPSGVPSLMMGQMASTMVAKAGRRDLGSSQKFQMSEGAVGVVLQVL